MADYNNDESKRTERMAKNIAVARQRMAEQIPQYDPEMQYTKGEGLLTTLKGLKDIKDDPLRSEIYKDFDKMVESPPHYADSEIECIDAMRASMTKEAFSGYCKGNVMKYLWRFEKKGEGTRDLEKAKVYLQWLIDNEKSGIQEMVASELAALRGGQ